MMPAKIKRLLTLLFALVPSMAIGLLTCGSPTFHCEAMPDSFSYHGLSYMLTDAGRTLQKSDLGKQFTTVGNGQKQVAPTCYLSAGTAIYGFTGYASTFRLATDTNGHVVLYQLVQNLNAKTGADFLDIGGKVQSISVTQDSSSNTTPAASVNNTTNAQQIEMLVTTILKAPVDKPPCARQGNTENLVFNLKDATIVNLTYWTGSKELTGYSSWGECMHMPTTFATMLSGAS